MGGTPENISDNTAVTATILETLDITADDSAVAKGSHGGVITISGMLSATTQFVGDDVEPLSLTASAKSLISGTWTAIDDDEVAVILDLSTLTVNVDPDAVSINNSILNGKAAPQLETMKPAVAATVAESMKRALSTRYTTIRRLDDVKVKGPLMKFEIGKTDYVFTRQGKAQ